MMNRYLYFRLLFVLLSASCPAGLHIKQRVHDHDGTGDDDHAVEELFSVAGAFSGGGCFSSLSQIGFLRGLLGQEFGDKIKFSVMTSSSGGSWGLGMIFAAAHKGTYKAGGDHQPNFSPVAVTTDEGTRDQPYYENELGRWCMYKQMNQGIHPKHWGKNLYACGKCSFEEEGCTGDLGLFGVAHTCTKSGQAYEKKRQEDAVKKDIKLLIPPTYVEMTGPGRALYMASTMQQQYFQFFEPQGMDINTKLKDVGQSLFSDDPKNGWRRNLIWNIFWSHYDAISPPALMNGVEPDCSGDSRESDLLLLQAVAQSSDAMSGLLASSLVSVEIYSACTFWTNTIAAMTKQGLLPYPFSKLSDLGAGVSKFHEAQFSQTPSTPVRVPMDVLQNAVNDPTDLVKFAQGLTRQQRRSALSSLTEKDTQKLLKQDGPIHNSWNVDGFATENNGIGGTLRMIDGLPDDKKPKVLISLVTGMVMSNAYLDDAMVGEIGGYFEPMVEYRRLNQGGGAQHMMIHKMVDAENCPLNFQEVNNPVHFFDYRMEIQSTYRPECTREIMLSAEENKDCWNFLHQARKRGGIFVEKAIVVPNKYFKIKGGFGVTLLISVLNKNAGSIKWVDDIYGDHVAKKTLRNFPFPEEGAAEMAGLGDTHAFALMNFNELKGYLNMCVITFFATRGKHVCNFCKRYPELCLEFFDARGASAILKNNEVLKK